MENRQKIHNRHLQGAKIRSIRREMNLSRKNAPSSKIFALKSSFLDGSFLDALPGSVVDAY